MKTLTSVLIVVVALTSVRLLAAQTPFERTSWEFAVAKGSTLSSASLGIVGSTRPLNHFRFGLGVRGTYVTGDLKLQAAGATNVPSDVRDTLSLPASVLMLNIGGHVSAQITDRLEVGMNIDLFGLGAGGSRAGSYRQSQSAPAVAVDASPATTNVFLFGSADRGSLNSEFFAAWHATNKLTIRAGLSHQLVEYRASRALASNTDRFRRYTNLGFIGVRVGR